MTQKRLGDDWKTLDSWLMPAPKPIRLSEAEQPGDAPQRRAARDLEHPLAGDGWAVWLTVQTRTAQLSKAPELMAAQVTG
jgi:hypothetical protein